MPNFYHFIYTRRDETGWGLLQKDAPALDLDAIEVVCRALPAPGDTPTFALVYAAALHGFVLCSCVRCESGDDHRGRILIDAAVAEDPAVRCDPALAALPRTFAQHWDPLWEHDPVLPQREDCPAPAPLMSDTLHDLLVRLGLTEAHLPGLLPGIYRMLRRQSGAAPLDLPTNCPPNEALRAFAALLSCVVPPAQHKNCTISAGPEALSAARFRISPGASVPPIELSGNDVQVRFYEAAAAKLCQAPEEYLEFLQTSVLDVLPEETISWQVYPYFYLLTSFERAGGILFQNEDARTLYLKNTPYFINFRTEYPALENRLRVLLTALTQACTDAETEYRQQLLETLTASGDPEALACLPEPLRTEAVLSEVERALGAPQTDILQRLALCKTSLALLGEDARCSIWTHTVLPRLTDRPLHDFAEVLAVFALPDEYERLTTRFDAALEKFFSVKTGWVHLPHAARTLAEYDCFAQQYGLTEHFRQALLPQLDEAFVHTHSQAQTYSLLHKLTEDLSFRQACLDRIAPYAPQPIPPLRMPSPTPTPQPSIQIRDPLLTWVEEYDRMLDQLADMLDPRADLPRDEMELPEPFLRSPFLQNAVQEAGRRLGLSKKQINALLGKRFPF